MLTCRCRSFVEGPLESSCFTHTFKALRFSMPRGVACWLVVAMPPPKASYGNVSRE
jgi:hypothetical protein